VIVQTHRQSAPAAAWLLTSGDVSDSLIIRAIAVQQMNAHHTIFVCRNPTAAVPASHAVEQPSKPILTEVRMELSSSNACLLVQIARASAAALVHMQEERNHSRRGLCSCAQFDPRPTPSK
jgi:hypothetical protein